MTTEGQRRRDERAPTRAPSPRVSRSERARRIAWWPPVLAVLLAALVALVSCAGDEPTVVPGVSPQATATSMPTRTSPPPAPVITAALLSHASYEEDESTVERAQAVRSGSLETTDEVARAGNRSGVALLEEDDPQYRDRLGFRSEWQSPMYAEQDQEYWYGVSFYLPEDWHQGENDDAFDDRIIFQFHEGTGASPAFSLHIHEDPDRFVVRRRDGEDDFDYLVSVPIEEGRWYDFAFRVNWTRDRDEGYFDVYVDHERVHAYQGRTLVDGRTVYTKWGVYGQPTHVYFDEVRIVQGEDGLMLANPVELRIPLLEPVYVSPLGSMPDHPTVDDASTDGPMSRAPRTQSP